MPNPENLLNHKFPKGKSGNPKGRPKLPEIQEVMAKILGETREGKSAVEAILTALRSKATKGDIRAAEVLLNRGYGLPKQDIELSGGLDIKQITGMEVK